MRAEGWYLDPFGAHDAPWFSDGAPTRLVRDGNVESNEVPPRAEFDERLVPVVDDEAEDGSDLLRADSEDSSVAPGDGPFQAFGASGGSFT
jgi:hypothetical protein